MDIEAKCHVGSHRLHLQHAILVYEDGQKTPAYVSVHKVRHDKRNARPTIDVGVPASKAGLQSMLRSLTAGSADKPALLDPVILAQGPGYMVWHAKAQDRQVWFNCKELGGERTAQVPNPGLVFLVTHQSWRVYAYKGTARPVPNTHLHVAPYFNVWDGGKICVGSIGLPKGQASLQPRAWEEVFFRSYFTHPNIHTPKGLTLHEGGAHAQWRDLLDGKHKRFPNQTLVPTNRTLQQIFDAVMSSEVEV